MLDQQQIEDTANIFAAVIAAKLALIQVDTTLIAHFPDQAGHWFIDGSTVRAGTTYTLSDWEQTPSPAPARKPSLLIKATTSDGGPTSDPPGGGWIWTGSEYAIFIEIDPTLQEAGTVMGGPMNNFWIGNATN